MEENNKHTKNGEFEDIVSDTHRNFNLHTVNTNDIMYFNTYSDSRHYKKHRHGIKKLFGIGDWWRGCKKWQKAMMISAVSVLLIISILATLVATLFNYNYRRITNNPNDLGFENVLDKEIVNIALFGVDSRDPKSFEGLSDSIMILSVNTKTKKIKIISVMRDTLVPIEYNGKKTYAKINSAYKRGGAELAIKTLNTVFKLDISEYATVNFFGMADIIDAVGGIEAELTEDEIYGKYGVNNEIFQQCRLIGADAQKRFLSTPGKQHLDGIQAVAYSRIRHQKTVWGTNDDYGRTDRQRFVMKQLFDKALTLDKSKYVSLAKALIPCSETSLSRNEILGLAGSVLLHSPTLEQTRVPLKEYEMSSKSISGVGSCVYYDLDYAAKLIHAFIYDGITQEDYMAQNGIQKNDWYKGSGSKSGSSGTTSSNTSSTVSSKPEDTVSEPKGTDEKPDDTSSANSSTDGGTDAGNNDGGNGNSSSTDGGNSDGNSSGGTGSTGNTGNTGGGSGVDSGNPED